MILQYIVIIVHYRTRVTSYLYESEGSAEIIEPSITSKQENKK